MKKTLLLMVSAGALLVFSHYAIAVERTSAAGNAASVTQTPDKAKKSALRIKAQFTADHPFNRALIAGFNTNPEFRSKIKEQYAVAEDVAKALGGWRPSIQLDSSITRNWNDTEVPLAGKGSLLTTTKNARAQISQNIFKGGETLAQVSKTEALAYAGFATLANTEQQVLLAVINAYLDLWAKRKVLEFNRHNVDLKQKTVELTKARYEVGEVSLTDVAQAESSLAEAIAQRIASEAEVATAVEVYQQVVGEMPGDVPPPPALTELREMPRTRHEVEAKALKNHPSIRAAEFSKKASDAEIDEAESAFLPSIDVTASASRSLEGSSKGSRANAAAIGVTLTVPIYQRGIEWANVRKATHLAGKAKLGLVATRRTVLQESAKNWENWRSAADQVEQIKAQIESAKVNLEGVRQENMVGERILLEVVQAENNLLKAESALVGAQKTYLVAGYSILASMGELLAVNLNLPVESYPVKEHYEHASSQWIGGVSYPTR